MIKLYKITQFEHILLKVTNVSSAPCLSSSLIRDYTCIFIGIVVYKISENSSYLSS